jgi:hypothetical protein
VTIFTVDMNNNVWPLSFNSNKSCGCWEGGSASNGKRLKCRQRSLNYMKRVRSCHGVPSGCEWRRQLRMW